MCAWMDRRDMYLQNVHIFIVHRDENNHSQLVGCRCDEWSVQVYETSVRPLPCQHGQGDLLLSRRSVFTPEYPQFPPQAVQLHREVSSPA